MINITDEDIEFAESILLKENQHFDDERIAFIKNLDTIDLQAVPGSGKTTALLAKLLILERYMPLADGRGILVISHTNAAVDEIKERIGKYCPKLFTYPNFIGTIQSFVDTFLAIPFYLKIYGKKPFRIDSEIYEERLSEMWNYKWNLSDEDFRKIKHIKKSNEKLFYDFRLGFDSDGKRILLEKLNGRKLNIRKPGGNSNYSDEEKKRLYKWFEILKGRILRKGILHHDDAYFFAKLSLLKNPKIKKILQARFQFLFVDEMQDMDTRQQELLEKIFFCGGDTQTIVQRVGDKNQAIYNNETVIWEPRENCLYINGSYRLTPKVGVLVQNFGLTPNPIEGRNQNLDGSAIDINPTVILYEDSTKKLVISTFANRIKSMFKNLILDFVLIGKE